MAMQGGAGEIGGRPGGESHGRAMDRVLKRPAASLATVALEAGVSAATVSRIVNGEPGRASAETVARVKAAVAALGYQPNHVGRALRRRESRVVAMLAPNLDNPAMAAIAVSTEAALRAAGYVMILCDTHDRADLQDEYLRAMRSQLVQGYVMVSTVKSRELDEARARGEAVVFVARRSPDGAGAYVGIDNRAAGADAADHFLALGIDRPAVLVASQNASSTAERAAGFVERLVSRGVPAGEIRQATAPGLPHLEIGYEAARRLVGEGGWPRGLLCVSDMMAYGAYRLAIETGVSIPRDCVLVGVDGNPLNDWIAPWLTSVRIPYAAFGEKIVSQLRSLWGGIPAGDILLPHRLEQ